MGPLVRHLGARADDLSPHTNKHGPCLSAVPCTSSSHPDDYRTLLSRLGGAATIAAIPPPAPVPQQIIITSNEETKEKNTMAVGYHTLLNIMTCAKYDPDSNALTDIKFPEPTDAFKRLFELTTKDERIRSLKNMLDTNNSMRPPGSEHNMLIMSRDYDDVDILIPTAIITGIYAKTEIKDMKSASTQFTLIHFRATGKDTAIALRKSARPTSSRTQLAKLKQTSRKSVPPFHPQRCLPTSTQSPPTWQTSSAHFRPCSTAPTPRSP